MYLGKRGVRSRVNSNLRFSINDVVFGMIWIKCKMTNFLSQTDQYRITAINCWK